MFIFKLLIFIIRVPLSLLPGTIGQSKSTKRYRDGVRLQGRGMLEEAIAVYDKVIEMEPYFVQAYCNRGAAYHQLGQP